VLGSEGGLQVRLQQLMLSAKVILYNTTTKQHGQNLLVLGNEGGLQVRLQRLFGSFCQPRLNCITNSNNSSTSSWAMKAACRYAYNG
jgi:hypothetical protein